MPPVCLEADASDPTSGSPRVALLIDAENITYRYASAVVAAAEAYGDVDIRFVFGNWRSPRLKRWLPRLEQFDLSRGPQFVANPGKNVTDANLMITAMDLVHERQADVLCIASGDADFAPVASRLAAELDITVVGIGPYDSADALIGSCDRFERVGKYIPPSDETRPH